MGFVEDIAPLIVAEGTKRGYKIFSTVIAQAVIESNYGKSQLSAKYHNYFGLKCGSSWKGASVNMKTKEEYKVGQVTTIKDNFRVYPDMKSGVAGYYDFISTSRYANLKTATTYKQYAERLKADGYATSSTYVNTLCNTVTKLGLQKYDSGDIKVEYTKESFKNDILPTISTDKNNKHQFVSKIQMYLNTLGFDCGTPDGVFGTKSKNGVIAFQKANSLTADGVIGLKTWEKLL